MRMLVSILTLALFGCGMGSGTGVIYGVGGAAGTPAGGASGMAGANAGGGGSSGMSGASGSASGAGGAPATVTGSQTYDWQNVTILGGGFVPGIVFSPVESGLAYARTDVGGAYRLDPGGVWVPITDWLGRDQQNLLGPESIALDPLDADKLYIAAGMYTGAGAGAVLRSSDRGETFQIANVPFKMGSNHDGRSMGERLVVDPNLTSVLYFGSRLDGLWKSTNGAVSFTLVSGFTPRDTTGMGISFVLVDPASGVSGEASSTIYAGMAGADPHVFVSVDAGASWQTLPGEPAGLIAHHAALDENGTLYLVYGNGPGPNNVTDGAVWKVDTATMTWTDITPEHPDAMTIFGYGGLSLDRGHPGTLVVSTIDRWSPGDEIFRSTDGGATWTALGPEAVRDPAGAEYLYFGGTTLTATGWMGDIDIDPFNPDHALYVTGQGVWGTDDLTAADSGAPTHWSFRCQGLEETVALGLVSPPTGPELFSALGDIGGFRHEDLSASPPAGMYETPRFGNTTSLDFAAADPNIMVRSGSGSTRRGRSAYSTDGGVTWTPFPAPEPVGSSGQGSIAITADGAFVLWAPLGTALPARRALDDTAWTTIDGLVARVSLSTDRVNPSKAYAFDGATGIVYVSEDAGASFAVASTGLVGGSTLAVVPGIEGDLWLTTNGRALYHSTDGGASFSSIPGVSRAYAIAFGMAPPEGDYPAIYLAGTLGTLTGLFRSDDQAKSFLRIDDERHQFGGVGVMAGDPRHFGRVYFGNSGRGVIYGEPAEP